MKTASANIISNLEHETIAQPLSSTLSLALNPRKLRNTLFTWIGFLITASILGSTLKDALGFDNKLLNVFYRFFNVALEFNIPTLFSFLQLISASLLCWIIRSILKKARSNKIHYWLTLSLIFLFLALDEALQIHEHFNKFSDHTVQINSLFYYTWTIPYTVFVSAAGIYFFNFLRSLPYSTRRLFIISGSLFVGAAVGLELIEGRSVYLYGIGNLIDVTLYTIEEGSEMIAIALFIYALLCYVSYVNKKINSGLASSL